MFGRQNYDLEILKKKTFMEDIEVTQSHLVRLFKCFRQAKIFNVAFRDTTLNLIK